MPKYTKLKEVIYIILYPNITGGKRDQIVIISILKKIFLYTCTRGQNKLPKPEEPHCKISQSSLHISEICVYLLRGEHSLF